MLTLQSTFRHAGAFLCAWLLAMFALAASMAPVSAQRSAGLTVQPDAALPAALHALQAFRGRITYRAYAQPATPAREPIAGTLTVSSTHWALDERSSQVVLHASPDGSWIRTGSQTLAFDDPLEPDALANAWAPALAGVVASGSALLHRGDAWATTDGALLYLQPDGSDLSGIVDARSPRDLAYTFADWITVNGLRVPQSVLRLRSGVSERGFRIADYTVEWAAQSSSAGGPLPAIALSAPSVSAGQTDHAGAALWRLFGTVFGLLLGGVLLVAWLRRDALTEEWCKALSRDPRGWRAEGASVFVTPEGRLLFKGHSYTVGAEFFNRAATVQSSPLFIRVSAPGVPHAVVMARRFGAPSIFLNYPHAARGLPTARSGFTLLEVLVATAMFATVIVAVVFPALVVLGQADRLAAERETALHLAANALVDEQAGLAYGTIGDTSRSEVVNGFTVLVGVKPAALPGLHAIAVEVRDARGRTVANVATLVGPPVPAPDTRGEP